MKRFFFESTNRCGIVVESDYFSLEGSRLHCFAQKLGTSNRVEILIFFKIKSLLASHTILI